VATGQIIAKIWRFFDYSRQRLPAAILGFQSFKILTAGTVTRAKLRHRAKFCGDRSNRCGADDGGRPPSWISDTHVWTTREGHLVFFIIV